MKKLLIVPLLLGVLLALGPSPATAQRGCDGDRANTPACQTLQKFRERADQRNGVTPACRSAATRYYDSAKSLAIAKNGVKAFRGQAKKAKSKKAKAKAAKGLKKAKKRVKKLDGATAKLKTAGDGACAGARKSPMP